MPTEPTHPSDPQPDRHEQRLVDLELKLTYLEDLTERLNDVIVGQQAQIDRLMRAVQELSRQAAAAEPVGFRSLRDELPPHY